MLLVEAMLTEIRLDDWKSFGSGEHARNTLKLGPVTLLVGPNASGKSNVLDAIRFLQGAAQGMALADVLKGHWEGGRQVWPGIRGHIAEAARLGNETFQLSCRLNDAGLGLSYAVQVGLADPVVIQSETLTRDSVDRGSPDSPAVLLFKRDKPTSLVEGQPGPAMSRIDIMRRPEITDPLFYEAQRSTLGLLRALLPDRPRNEALDHGKFVQQALAGVTFLDINPAAMRDYKPIGSGPLGVAGENISPVLYSLEKKRLADVMDWLSELCAPELQAIAFDKTQLREVMMFLVEKEGHRISARSASDGTLRFLGLLVALLTCPAGTLMVLEEPDVGLHPSRIRLLAELFEGLAKRRGIQILATTHSPTLLSHLSKETLGDVVAFGRDPQTGWTACSTLADLPHFATLRDATDLEHLISTGWLERAL
jgi:predicted ATPase